MKKKTIGIIGGMGPLATIDLYNKILSCTCAENDQDNIHVIIDSNTSIPDRTKAILHSGESPLYELIRSAHRLEFMGADILIMACNTAHYYYEQMAPHIKTLFIHMIDETAKEVRALGYGCVGLLASEGTCRSGIYDMSFKKLGIELIKPSEEAQRHVTSIIYDGVKAGKAQYPTHGLHKALEELSSKGAEAFVLGCTELPVAFARYGIEANTIDPTEVLARRAVERALADDEKLVI